MTAEASTCVPVATEVRCEPDQSRYTLWLDGKNAGFVDYRSNDREMRFTHTEIDPAQRRRGLAGALVQQALDDVRTKTGLRVVAQCPYVRAWIDRHAEYQDLLTRGR
jgi:predicted GNAT family acetyltransferase